MKGSEALRMKKIASLAGVIVTLFMFIISGMYKFAYSEKYVSMLQSRIGGSEQLNKLLIVCAGLLQLAGSSLIIIFHTMSFFDKTHDLLKLFSSLAVIGLLLFTLLTTYLFKLPSLSKENPWPFLSNISIAGAFLLMLSLN